MFIQIIYALSEMKVDFYICSHVFRREKVANNHQ